MGVTSVLTFHQQISDEPTKSTNIKTKQTMRDAVWFVNLYNCIAYDWMIKDEGNITWHDPEFDVVNVSY